MFSDLRIKAGQSINFDVNVEGEPTPKIEWFLNGEPIQSLGKTKIDNSNDNNTKLDTKDAVRADTGKYKIVATNENGRDEAEVNVNVLDIPGTPEGPLSVKDITKDGCSLRWNPPEDDGGSPITNYIVEKQEDGGRWVPAASRFLLPSRNHDGYTTTLFGKAFGSLAFVRVMNAAKQDFWATAS
ncbi:hypothetical protein Y032_0044g1070 [Ancylostoma ceylanicum]|uniref:Immunoglobulin I-set domain protein n=1 Tax=Ancylostoma ceylanicum TaxID=53326 RepID=A0A016UF65_9BILA|nr:hypothetical protein Y032_0044g1070 [Ancylostoma ceylanicum]